MEIPPQITKLRGILDDWPEASDISHAHCRYGPDGSDTEPIPSMLRFTYCQAVFFAVFGHWRPDLEGHIRIEVPTNHLANPTFGAFTDLDSPTFLDDLKAVLDPLICPPIVVSEYGDTLIFESMVTDEKEIGRFSFAQHHGCGGGMYWHDISDFHRAMSCGSCNLRIVFPSNATTIGALRRWAMPIAVGVEARQQILKPHE